jgi:hypothetical protein
VLTGASPGIYVRRGADVRNVIKVKSSSGWRYVSLGPKAVALLRRWLLVVPKSDGFEDPDRKGRKLQLMEDRASCDGKPRNLSASTDRRKAPGPTTGRLLHH